MESLKGKIALVTGGGKGIGRAIAIALANEGVHVGLIARTEKDLQSVADDIKSIGVKASIATADVSDIESVNAAVESIQKELGNITFLSTTQEPGRLESFLN